MNRLRTLLFSVLFYGLSVPIVLTVPVSALFGRRAVMRHAHAWARVHRALYRSLLGIRVRVEGQVPDYPVFFAAKHQAMFETLELQLLLGGPMRDAKALKAEGRSILIYPEGTRVVPGERPPLQSGFAGLYRALGMPCVPVALDTGRVWPKHGPKRPGVVTIRIGELIPPGLPRDAIEARVHAAINVLDV